MMMIPDPSSRQVTSGNTSTTRPVPTPAPTQPNTTYPPVPAPGSTPEVGTDNVSMVQNFADVIYTSADNSIYTQKALLCTAYIKRPISLTRLSPTAATVTNSFLAAAANVFNAVPALRAGYTSPLVSAVPRGSGLQSYPYVSTQRPVVPAPNLEQSNSGVKARLNVLSFMDDVSAFISRATAAGFAPPDNPFTEIAKLQASRTPGSPVVLRSQLAGDILFNIQSYVDLLQAQQQGAINFDTAKFNIAQLEHLSLSYSGLGGTGNVAADLMKLLPNADEIKLKKSAEALAVLNFANRQPSMVFTAEYAPNQNDGHQGVMLGWKKINDAAGYIIKRHAIMTNEDVDIEVSNDQLVDTEAAFMNYAKAYVLTFYDRINPANMCLYVDATAKPDDYYIYRLQAYQIKKDDGTAIIPSSFITLNLSGQQKTNINARIKELDPNAIATTGEETISPWPVFAEQILGDASLDWIFAAANIRAAIDRNDPKATSRSYSYLNAKTTWLLSQADQGKLVKPSSIDAVRQAITNSIRTYGVMQTVEALLQETGILYYFDARDARTDTTFDRAGTLDFTRSSIIAPVAAAIDPENATVNLKTLSTNLFQVLTDGKLESYDTSLRSGAVDGAKPTEIRIDPDVTTDMTADTNIQYVQQLNELSETTVDLTTFDGIAKFIRAIRTMSDFGPNRIPPVTGK